MYRIAFITAALLAVALGLLVGTLNSDTVSVDLLWVQLQWPLGLLLLCILFVGLVLGEGDGASDRRRLPLRGQDTLWHGLVLGLLVCWIFSIVPLKARLRKVQNKEPYRPDV